MKKIIIVASVACMALAAGIFFGLSKSNEVVLSDLTKTNLEALGKMDCPNPCMEKENGCACNGSHPGNHEVDF